MSRKTRKLIWSAPLVAAIAVVAALAIFMALQPNQAAAQTEEEVPGVPMKLTAKGISPTSIELAWDPPMSGDGGIPDAYRIDFSEDGMVWYSRDPSYDSALYTDDDGLSANEKRYYRVFAVNSAGSSDVLGPVMGTTLTSTVPDAIEDLRASVGANTEKDPVVEASTDPASPAPPQENIALIWSPPDDPEGAPVMSYRIQVSKDGRSWRNLATKSAKDAGCAGATGDCTHTHKELLESTDRQYRVYAMNKIGESDASNAPEGSSELGEYPTAVVAVRAGLNPAGEIYLYWDESTPDPDGAPVLGYYIQGATAAANGTPTLSDTPSKDNLQYVSANTDIPITTKVQNKLDPDRGTNPVWSFRVIASNRVVDRALLDGTLTLTSGSEDGNASDPALTFDASPDTAALDTDDLLDAPTLKVSRDTNNVGGRVSLILEWQADDAVTDTTYRIEHSTDLVDWEVIDQTGNDDFEEIQRATDADAGDPHMGRHINLVAGTTHHYRVFAEQNRTAPVSLPDDVFTEASRNVKQTTTGAAMPDSPVLDDPDGYSEMVIRMSWAPPGIDTGTTPPANPEGTEPVGYGKIIGYLVESSADGTTWTELVTVGPKLDKRYSYNNKTGKLTEKAITANHMVDFEHTMLYQDQTVHYRISTINNASPRSRTSDTSFAKSATTKKAQASDDPGGLVAKPRGRSMIELTWNARADDIIAAPIIGYKIESSPLNMAGDDCAETWSTLVEDTMSTTTSYTHMGLSAGTGMCYRVFGINVVATSTSFVGYGDAYVTTNDNDAIAITDAAVVPGAPTATLGTVTDSEIIFSWTGPADDGGSAITGWIVEKAYGGSFLDEMRTNTDAFTDAQTWWDGLDCPAMVAAVMDDGTADMNNPFCAMYADLDDASEAEVERVFAARYFVIDDATANTYRNYGLSPETERMYRIAAVNGVGIGAWSNVITATTLAAMAPELGMATNVRTSLNTGGTITVIWDAADNAVGYIVIAIDTGDLTAVSDPVNPDSSGVTNTTLNLGGLTVGREYNIYVAATDAAGDFTLSAPLLGVTAE